VTFGDGLENGGGGKDDAICPRFVVEFTEMDKFTAACLDNTPVPLPFQGAVEAVQIGSWLQEAIFSRKQIPFDESSRRIDRANLKATACCL
jgi:hypothetical protein